MLRERACPKCACEMESIETGVDGPPFHQLQLCPNCYLVAWSDADGIHLRQGVPMKPGGDSLRDPGWFIGEPQKC